MPLSRYQVDVLGGQAPVVLHDANQVIHICCFKYDIPVELRMIIIKYHWHAFLYYDINTTLGNDFVELYKMHRRLFSRLSLRVIAHVTKFIMSCRVIMIDDDSEVPMGYTESRYVFKKQRVVYKSGDMRDCKPVWQADDVELDPRVYERAFLKNNGMSEHEVDDEAITPQHYAYDYVDEQGRHKRMCAGRCLQHFYQEELGHYSQFALCNACDAFYEFYRELEVAPSISSYFLYNNK
jgi:hypothetical protein